MPEGKSEIPADILAAAEEVFDMMLCNCTESCGGTAGLRKASIEELAKALLVERQKCHRQIENMMDDFFLIEQRIYDGQTDRARGTAYQGAKEACRILGISPIPTPVTLRRPAPPSSTEENFQHD